MFLLYLHVSKNNIFNKTVITLKPEQNIYLKKINYKLFAEIIAIEKLCVIQTSYSVFVLTHKVKVMLKKVQVVNENRMASYVLTFLLVSIIRFYIDEWLVISVTDCISI